MFNEHIQNKLSGTGKERGGGGGREGTTCTGGYKGVQAVRLGSVAGGGCYCVMEFGMSRGIKPKIKYVRISNEGNWVVCQKVKGLISPHTNTCILAPTGLV